MDRTRRTCFARADVVALQPDDWAPVVEEFDAQLRWERGDTIIVESDRPVALLELAAKLRAHSDRTSSVFHYGRDIALEHHAAPARKTMDLLARSTPAGQFLATDPFYRELQPANAGVVDAAFESLGRYRLRPGGETMEIFALRFSDAPATELAIGSTNLPPERGGFYGRRTEVEQIDHSMNPGEHICLHGPAGIGKSQLAVAYARRFKERRPDYDVWHLDLSVAEDLHDIFRTVNAEIGIPFSNAAGTDEMYGQVASALDSRGRSLVVLDGIEPVQEVVVESLERLMPQLPEVSWLSTSRRPVADGRARNMEIGPLDESPAVELFVVGARRVRLDFLLTEARTEDIVEIVRTLDHHPLAIELAARQLRSVGLGELRDQLRENGAPDAPDSGILDRYFGPSTHLLTADQRRALGQLTAFRGRFPRATALAVLSLESDADPAEVFGGLVDLAFVRTVDSDSEIGELLFEVPNSIAEQSTPDDTTLEGARERHLEWFAERARQFLEDFRSGEKAEALAHLETLYTNFDRAFDVALERESRDAYPVALALHAFYLLRGPAGEGLRMLKRAAEFAEDRGDSEMYVRLRARRANIRALLGAVDEPRATLGELVERLDTIDHDPTTEAEVLRYYSHSLSVSNEFDRAAEMNRRGLGVAEGEAPYMYVRTLIAACFRLRLQDKDERAVKRAREAIERAREGGYTELQARALRWYGQSKRVLGEFQEATAAYRESLELFERLGARKLVAQSFDALGEIALQRGQVGDAYRYLSRAHEIVTNHWGEESPEAMSVHLHLGELALEQLDFESARRHLRRAHRGYAQRDFSKEYGFVELRLAMAEAALGHEEAARECLEQAEASLEAFDEIRMEVVVELVDLCIPLGAVRSGAAGEEQLRSVRERLRAIRDEHSDDPYVPELARFVEKFVRHLEGGSVDTPARSRRLVVSEDAERFRTPDGEVGDISNRSAPRRILDRLVRARIANPGQPVSLFELVDAGWPDDEELPPDTARNRMYVAIQTLREAGLRGILTNEPGGYYLDPSVPLQRGSVPDG